MRKNRNGFVLLVFMLVCISDFCFARSARKQIRIACIGNSITYGARLQDRGEDAYPVILQHLFGNDRVMVRNFGLSGATMIHDGSPNVWQQLDGIKRYLPQVVIIIIGTNETVSGNRRNWEHIDNFKKDYADFLQQLQSLASHPVIFICSPTDMNLKTTGLSAERSGDLTLRRPRLWELRKRIKSIARESSVNFIDLTPRFKNRPALFTPGDGVHPNKQGYYYLAELIFKNIKANVYNLLK